MFSCTSLASRLAVIGAAAVVAGVGVAGCSSSASSSAPAAAPSTSASATAASSAAATSAAVSTPASAAVTGPAASSSSTAVAGGGAPAAPACGSMDLAAHVGLAQGTAGSIYQVIYFTNLSNTSCSLYGYPGVALAAGSSQVNQVGVAAARDSTTAATVVTLGAGQSASATLRIVEAGNYPTGTCKPTATSFLQIFPPGQTTPIYLAYKSTGCTSSAVNLLSVTTMTPGTGG